jgi:phosphoglycerate kinase
MPAFRTLDQVSLAGKRVVCRVDLNVPIADGKVTDTTRIERVVPTMREILDKGAALILLAHFERPKGKVVPELSLKPVAAAVEKLLGRPVRFVFTDWQKSEKLDIKPGECVLMENTRFHPGEESNDAGFAKTLAGLGDIFVNDAFSAAHRAHASTEGIAHLIPSYAGRAMEAELKALDAALEKPRRPVIALVGGAKVSTKLDLLGNLVSKVEALVIGGAMANTFLLAQGHAVGKSLVEKDLADTARSIRPMGAFETPPFDRATVDTARYAAARTKAGKLASIAGGGDTVAALNHAGVGDQFTYVSTAGGAFLEWLEGKTLPGVKALEVTT